MAKVYYNYPTGWTIKKKKDRLLLRGNSEAKKLFSMRGHPVFWGVYSRTQITDYSRFNPQVRMPVIKGQFAWVVRQFSFSNNVNVCYKLKNINNKNLTFNITSLSKRFLATKAVLQKPSLRRDYKLDPWFITGLIDSEGCFFLNISLSKTHKNGFAIKPSFKLALNIRDMALLEKIQNFFGVGVIYKQRADSLEYRIQNLKDLEIIISHLDKYPLYTQKLSDYLLLRKAIYLLLDKKHLTTDGLRKIVSIKSVINWGLSDKLKLAFPDILHIERPLVTTKKIENASWLAGFTSGDGCFTCPISKSNTKLGEYASVRFLITQHSKDEQLMRNIIEYLGCGVLYKKNERVLEIAVNKLSDISKKIIPFFTKYPVEGVKHQDFLVFCKIAELVNNKAHLTKDGLDKIRSMKSQMNTGRDFSVSDSILSNTINFSSISDSNGTSLAISENLTNSSKDIVRESDITVQPDSIQGGEDHLSLRRVSSLPSVTPLQRRKFSSLPSGGSNSPPPVAEVLRVKKLQDKILNPIAQWELKLVGLTDSDVFDSFSIDFLNGNFLLKYNIYQPIYNLRLLYHIKNNLGYGKVLKFKARQLACLTISDLNVLKEKIFTIFDKYPLLTNKYFFYKRFKDGLGILENNRLSTEEKTEALEKLRNISLPVDYISPAISHLTDKSNFETIKSAVSNYWLSGFIEGRGNFLVVRNEQGVFHIEFYICIKRDKLLLNLIKRLLHIPNKVIFEDQRWLLKTKHNRAISNIIEIFSSYACKFKGMKSLEFKLWKRAAFYNKKLNFNKVAKIRKITLKLHKKQFMSKLY